jgi:hypothetical protein
MDKIKFIESTHQYLTEDDRELISVSKFTDKFKEKVNWDIIAGRMAIKETKVGNPTTKKDILDKWEEKRFKTAEVGTLYHSIREKELLDSENPVFYNVPCEKRQCDFKDNIKYSIPINKLENNTVYTELMIYDFDHMICGQADKVVVVNDKINVFDYKTDNEIKFHAFSSQWVSPKKMLSPLSHLDDANGNHYSIKMSLYMYMLWKANKGKLMPGDIIIEHISLKRDIETGIPILQDGKPIVEKIENITLPYRKKEVMDMLKTLNL